MNSFVTKTRLLRWAGLAFGAFILIAVFLNAEGIYMAGKDLGHSLGDAIFS